MCPNKNGISPGIALLCHTMNNTELKSSKRISKNSRKRVERKKARRNKPDASSRRVRGK